jgi:hypothetical protein
MRLIDADALIQNHFSDEHRIALSYADKLWMRRIISDDPTIDAVPVIRCEHCKFCSTVVDFIGNRQSFCGEYPTPRMVKPKDFCSRGERKEATP